MTKTLTMSIRHNGVLAALVVVGLAACGGSGKASVTSTGPTGATGANKTAAASATNAANATTAPAASGDLAKLVADYVAGYQFSTTITVGSTVATSTSGRRNGTGTSLSIIEKGAQVDEIITPDGVWVRNNGKDWTKLSTKPTTADPMTPLASPKSSSSNSDGTLAAVYPAESFGLPAGDLKVTLGTKDGHLSTLRYETTISGQAATVVTNFSALTDTSAITAPV
jgi:hypothetical protein